MDFWAWIALAVIFIIMIVVKSRNMDKDYTLGKGIFKNSEHNIELEKNSDISDNNYYNDTDKLK